MTVAGINVAGADAHNYIWNTTTTTTADIERATLSVTGATAQDRVYDGTTAVAIHGATLSGVFGNDAVALTNANTGSMADKHVGNDKAVTTAMGLSGADANNYVLLQPAGLTVDITPRELLVSATGHSRPYDGTTAATVTLSDDRIAGDTLTLSYVSAAFVDAARRQRGCQRDQSHRSPLRRRMARMRRVEGLCLPTEVRENPLDRSGRLDAGDHTKAPAAAPAGLDLEGEYPLEALRPRQAPSRVAD